MLLINNILFLTIENTCCLNKGGIDSIKGVLSNAVLHKSSKLKRICLELSFLLCVEVVLNNDRNF